MVMNKNQHYVPRCYLRPFTHNAANLSIDIFNIDRRKFFERAPVKNQCSRNYFYGEDLKLEKAFQSMEAFYAQTLRKISDSKYSLETPHSILLKRFWLLQFLRTEAASMRAVKMTQTMENLIDIDGAVFRLEMRQAVQLAMTIFVEEKNIVDDLKICLLKNQTSIPFITSDDPAVLTNRWYLEVKRGCRNSYGLASAGTLLILPLTPWVLCIGYDGDVYSLPNENGWISVRRETDVQALNQHQFLNCMANIYMPDLANKEQMYKEFTTLAPLRPVSRDVAHYAIFDHFNEAGERYCIIDHDQIKNLPHQKALIHSQIVYPCPTKWPSFLRWRTNGTVYTNGSGTGFVRRSISEKHPQKGYQKKAR